MTTMPFGKHAGEEIADIDPSYLRWLLRQDWFVDKFSRLVDEVEDVLDDETDW